MNYDWGKQNSKSLPMQSLTDLLVSRSSSTARISEAVNSGGQGTQSGKLVADVVCGCICPQPSISRNREYLVVP